MTLDDLGFRKSEIFRCRATGSGLLYLPATVDDERTEVVFDTTSYLPLWVLREYVIEHALPVTRESEGTEYCRIENLRLLGGRIPDLEAPIQPEGGRNWPGLGNVGPPLVGDAILALDPAGPWVGLTHRLGVSDHTSEPWARIPLLKTSTDGIAISSHVASPAGSGDAMIVLFSTMHSRSAIARGALPRLEGSQRRKRRKRAEHALTLTLGDRTAWQDCQLVDSIPGYPWHPDVPPIDVRLGWDFLCGFCSVFDFAAHQLRLYPYGPVEADVPQESL